MLLDYMRVAMQRAEYKKLDDGTWFAEIPGLDGVWANADTVEACRSELADVLDEWLLLKVHDGDPLPTIDGLEINVHLTTT